MFVVVVVWGETEQESHGPAAGIRMQAAASNAALKNSRGDQLNTIKREKMATRKVKSETIQIDLGDLLRLHNKLGIIILYQPNHPHKIRIIFRVPAGKLIRISKDMFFDGKWKDHRQANLRRGSINAKRMNTAKTESVIRQASAPKQDIWTLIAVIYQGKHSILTSLLQGNIPNWYPRSLKDWEFVWFTNGPKGLSQKTIHIYSLFCVEVFGVDYRNFINLNAAWLNEGEPYDPKTVKFHGIHAIQSPWISRVGGFVPIPGKSTWEELAFLGPKLSSFVVLFEEYFFYKSFDVHLCVFIIVFNLKINVQHQHHQHQHHQHQHLQNQHNLFHQTIQ